jgi:P27 family predicted phage terminase small subunit
MTGRRPKPTHLRLITGNPGKRALPKREPKPPPGIPTPPAFLSDEALAEWNRVTPQLDALGMLSELDMANLVGYVVAWSDFVEAQAHVTKFGRVVRSPIRTTTKITKNGDTVTETSGGYPIQSPMLAIRNRALEQIRTFSSLFGMSPSERARMGLDHDQAAKGTADKSSAYF